MSVATKVQSAPAASAILPLILVFLCGVTVGALIMSLGLHRAMHLQQPVSHESQKNLTVDLWKRELDLTPAQTVQIESVLDDFAKYYDNVLAYGNSRILQVLNDQQKLKFQHMVDQRRK